MTDIPAGWYDDPENASQWRYWDGTTWTDHRSPKGMPPAPGSSSSSESVWQLIPNSFSLVGRYWRELTVVGLPVVLLTMAGYVLVWVGFDQALNISVDDFFDRVTDPGFDPNNDVADDLWWDSLEFDVAPGVVWWVLAGVAFLAAGLGNLAFTRFLVGAAAGSAPAPIEAYTGSLGRVPRVIGWVIVLIGAWLAATIIVVVLAVIVPLTLIVTIPSVVVAAIWSIPYITMAMTTIVAGPRDAQPLTTARGMVTGRWWAFVGRFLMIWIVVVAVGIPLSFISGPLFASAVLASLLVSTISGTVQAAIGQSGTALVYRWAGGPVDPDLTGPSHTAPTES